MWDKISCNRASFVLNKVLFKKIYLICSESFYINLCVDMIIYLDKSLFSLIMGKWNFQTGKAIFLPVVFSRISNSFRQ